MNTQRIYLDHNASSLLRPCVKTVIEELLAQPFGNASSIHALGRHSRDRLDAARRQIAAYLAVPESQLIFTSGATESNHLAWNAFIVDKTQKHRILSSNTEHPCIMGAQDKARTDQHDVQCAAFHKDHAMQDSFKDAVGHTAWSLCSLHVANNETGAVLPIMQCMNLLIEQGLQKPFIHVDAVQAAGKMQLDSILAMADYASVSGHKLGALAGTGVLIKKDGVPFTPLWQGSAQEKGRRGGTENLMGIVAMGAACQYLKEHGKQEQAHCLELRDTLEQSLSQNISNIDIVCQDEQRLSNTSCIIFKDIDAQALLVAADLEGIDVSTGAACTSGSVEPSHVLLNMGYSKQEASSAIRFSLGWNNTYEEVAQVCKIFPKLVERARQSKP